MPASSHSPRLRLRPRCSHCVLRRGLKFGPATRKALGADRRSGAARGRGRPVHRQERQCARHRRAGRACRRPGWRSSGPARRPSSRPQDLVKLGGAAMGRSVAPPTRRRSSRNLPRPAQAGPGGRSRARRAAARLRVRPLQDQAQGRRGAARQARSRIAVANRGGAARPGAPREPVADGVMHGARPRSTSRPTCSIPWSSPAARRAARSSAWRSRCSTCRR